MTHDSDIVLRWEVDNATARSSTGKVESDEFDKGGFKWTAVAEQRLDSPHDKIEFSLRCDVDRNGPWKCDTEVAIWALSRDDDYKEWLDKNALAKYAIGKVKLEEIYEGIYKWKAAITRVADRGYFTLRSATDHSLRWKCEANVKVWEIMPDKSTFQYGEKRILFDQNEIWTKCAGESWFVINDPDYHANGKATIEFRIHIISDNLSKFAAPNNRSDVILKIGDKDLHVSKEFLAVHSPVFAALFFGDYVEKEKEEIEIKDVVYEEFIDLLQLLYFRTVNITDSTIPHILKLADQFQIEQIILLPEKYLIQSDGIDIVSKLLLADQYRLDPVTNHCLQSFTSITDSRIENALAKYAIGKVEVEEIYEGGYKWKAAITRVADRGYFTLRCATDHSQRWKCEANVKVWEIMPDKSTFQYGEKRILFDQNEIWTKFAGDSWLVINDPDYHANGKATIEFRIHIISE